MKHDYFYALGLSLTLLLAGCSKDESGQAKPAPTLTAKETLLTAKNWRITAVVGATTFMGNTITVDGFKQMPACEKDNFYKDNADKTAVTDERATRCSTSAPQTQTATWSFNAAGRS
ncbi:hypothetical protein GCM10022408_22030 [Hymenobacter fastidiosus]|uniref:Uncharacterized protein n=1 Tax=Hymenobacter fastidiosus TaxID=486264 RepID=A0ABP7SBF4_9BACT